MTDLPDKLDEILTKNMPNGVWVEEAKAQILALIPEKVSLQMNKYHHQTQIDGYNQAISDVLKALGDSNG